MVKSSRKNRNTGSSLPQGRRSSEGRFTLIELLIVIAVISILTAMMLPGISGVRSLARKAACINNLRQVGMSILSYADSYNGFLPRAANSTAYDAPYAQWLLAAEGRLDGTSDWHYYQASLCCPIGTPNPKNKIFGGCPSLGEGPYRLSLHHNISDYGYNATHGNGVGVFPIADGKWNKLTSLNTPSGTLAYIDAAQGIGGSSPMSNWSVLCYPCYPTNSTRIDPRHKGGCCMVLFDGHVEWHPQTWYLGSSSFLAWGHGVSIFNY